jgi:kinesin family protein 18/19
VEMSCNAFWLSPFVLTIRSFLQSIFLKIRSCIQVEVTQLRRELADKETQLSARTPEKEKLADDELSWLDVLSHDINENVQERINLQKALFELEDMNLHNRAELQQLDDLIMNLTIRRIGEKEEALVERRQVVLDNIRDNDEAATHYRQDIEHNEAQRKELQRLIDEAIDTDHNKTFLRILSQYRLLVRLLLQAQCQYQASPEPSKSVVGSEVSSSMPPEAGVVVPMV